jgi:hypothetical protein
MNAVIEATPVSSRTVKSHLMPSIQATSYPVSAMVPSTLPVQPAANTNKTAAQKTDAVAPTGSGTSVSDRVSAFLASDTTTEKTNNRTYRQPPPPAAGKGAEGSGGSESSSQTAALFQADTDNDAGQVDADTDTQSPAVLFDEAKTYYPTSIY